MAWPLCEAVGQGIPDTNSPVLLTSWSFTDTNYWVSDWGYSPLSLTNLSSSTLGNGPALVVDSTAPAWLQYNVTENDGTTNLTVDQGSVILWFAPAWSSTNQGGTGPGEWSRLIEVGSYTTNASYGWWSLYTDPEGVNLYFSGQTNDGSQGTYLCAPIAWNTNRWHLIALTYFTNTALYVDGELVTNGLPVTYWPGPDVLANGFYIGSASDGSAQAHGMIDSLATYAGPLDAGAIHDLFWFGLVPYDFNPYNSANISSAPYTPSSTPVFNAVAGQGALIPISTNTTSCVTSNIVWISNATAVRVTNATTTLTFTISGGSNGLPYDVFANSVLDFSSNTNLAWAWMGQGYQCVTYTLTNMPNTACFLILGTPLDSDQDGLTDAYERLVSKTDPHNAASGGDGMWDGWKVLWGLNPLVNYPAQTGQRANFTYYPEGWLSTVSGLRSGAVTSDFEGNLEQTSQ